MASTPITTREPGAPLRDPLAEPIDTQSTLPATSGSSLRETTPSKPNNGSTVSFASTSSSGESTSSDPSRPRNSSSASQKVDGNGASAGRHRAVSTVSTASISTTTSSIASIAGSGVVSDKRQAEFRRHFESDLSADPRSSSDDFHEVLATQSTDLQSSVLIHGRLYLTRHYLCFRANIIGIVTKKIYPLKDITNVEKGTTAKWIQNAIYIYLDGEERYIGYGSLGDRDAMYDDVVAAWRVEAPERYEKSGAARGETGVGAAAAVAVAGPADIAGGTVTDETRGRESSETVGPDEKNLVRMGTVKATTVNGEGKAAQDKGTNGHSSALSTETPKVQSAAAVNGESSSTQAPTTSTDSKATPASSTPTPAKVSSAPSKAPATPAKTTTCSGEHYKEVAIDTTFHIPMNQVFELVYKNQEFIMDFYEQGQGLKDVKISEWSKSGEGEERSLSYVMTINNPIGPNESECFGSEKVVIAKPEEAYEILSETKTPGLPAGKSFAVKTRTCLTHAELHGKPATRMYCTSQCDWSSFSMLKSTITPAVIKGQKTYHEKLAKGIRHWIHTHPEDYEVVEDDDDLSGGEDEDDATSGQTQGQGQTEGEGQGDKGLPSYNEDGTVDLAVEKGGSKSSIGKPPTTRTRTKFETMQDLNHTSAGSKDTSPKSYLDYALEIPLNPVMSAITLLCALLLYLEISRWASGRTAVATGAGAGAAIGAKVGKAVKDGAKKK